MRAFTISCLVVVLGWPLLGTAQDASPPATGTTTPPPDAAQAAPPPAAQSAAPAEPTPEGDAPAAEDEPASPPEEPAAGTLEAGESTAPDVTELALPPASEMSIPTPGELGDRLVGDLPEAAAKASFTAPTPVLTLHGYLRVRGELMDTFWLGRGTVTDVFRTPADPNPTSANRANFGPDPFSRFRPLERSLAGTPCGDEGTISEFGQQETRCDVDTLQFASMRFRLSPQLNVSEDVRIKTTFDVFDNYVLGRAPGGFYGRGAIADTAFVGTDVPVGDTIVARRAWAEVRNRDLGELRFGIMPQHWGLGMLYNSGDGLDDDYSTDLGRVLAITKVAGFYVSASYDFIAEGVLGATDENRPDYDGSQIDDVDQFTISVARRMPDEDEESVLARGDLLLNGGVQFTLRNQDARYVPATGMAAATFQNLSATYYTPDVWGQLRYRGLRVELEAAWALGSITQPDVAGTPAEYDINQFGAALETELRLLDDQLALYLYAGLATGDSDVEGLSSGADYLTQLGSAQGTDDTISTFRFHPSYRVDMILWRNIMRQVTGAYYIKPGISYDFVRDEFGQLFGARLDFIWSRATAFLQTPGNDEDLGIELNAQIYWRSDDGPDQNDGYHAALQYGVLFPMKGLGYYHQDADLDTAQNLRLVLGVVF